eukprot:CAMPEP_0198258456 /NCGR_PEP_ID=MMETSP1447-20131203/7878_1 /TAXON_ID=420782 /ORGANISM="Chaetoceros dichaeta, Strain CCMP1751" /LENGTH=177 /DNA_ID=CAMNT_0043945577 /DNA_START=60 /DNA_END=593 /DNA_ORIENTATION=-
MIYHTALLLLCSTVVSAENLRDPTARVSADNRRKPKEGVFCLEKGIKCSGGLKNDKFGVKCEGGSKFGAEEGAPAQSVMESVAKGLHEHLQEGYLPDVDGFMPAEEEMYQIMEMENGLSSIEDGEEKSVDFGGVAKVEWGCKATFGRKDGKGYKKVDCGFKGGKGVGKKADDTMSVL